ncbi:MAG: sugar transferase [Clostridia bacterium]
MYNLFFKRIIDFSLSVIALPILAIVFIIIAPLVFISDFGPVFYSANRIGRNGKLFRMHKFRTMKVNSPDIRLADGSTYNGEDDPRVTKIGKFLRATSIDEIPQLINVLIGQMSLIGPRPDPPDWLERYPEEVKVFLSVRPGITGYSQAYFRNSVDGREKMINDVFYAKNISFLFDCKILLRTLITIFKKENIYK